MATFTSWTAGVSTRQMREIDRVAEADYGISPIQLMEVAGLATARVARSLVGSPLTGRRVCILSGPGNNGADGLVAARRLAGWGATAIAVTSYDAGSAKELSRIQLQAAQHAGVEILHWSGEIPASDLIIDALLGFGAQGVPRAAVQAMIVTANRAARPLLALDVPSGIDAETGEAPGDCIAATATLTLALPKTGLLAPVARALVGRLFLADIGIPPSLLRGLGIDGDGLFAADDILELDPASGNLDSR